MADRSIALVQYVSTSIDLLVKVSMQFSFCCSNWHRYLSPNSHRISAVDLFMYLDHDISCAIYTIDTRLKRVFNVELHCEHWEHWE